MWVASYGVMPHVYMVTTSPGSNGHHLAAGGAVQLHGRQRGVRAHDATSAVAVSPVAGSPAATVAADDPPVITSSRPVKRTATRVL